MLNLSKFIEIRDEDNKPEKTGRGEPRTVGLKNAFSLLSTKKWEIAETESILNPTSGKLEDVIKAIKPIKCEEVEKSKSSDDEAPPPPDEGDSLLS